MLVVIYSIGGPGTNQRSACVVGRAKAWVALMSHGDILCDHIAEGDYISQCSSVCVSSSKVLAFDLARTSLIWRFTASS